MKKRLIISTLIILGTCSAVFGQNVKNTENKADQSLKSNARVNPSTLAMELSIPIGGYPGRAGNGLPVNFDYSSKVWEIKPFDIPSWERSSGTITTDTRPVFANRSAAGWTSGLGVPRIDYKSQEYEGGRPDITEGRAWAFVNAINGGYYGEPFPVYYVKRLSVIMADGSSHEFRVDDSINGNGTIPGTIFGIDQTGVYLSVDGSKMRLEVSASSTTLFMPDGSRYLFPPQSNQYGHEANTFIDRNGNKMLYDSVNRRWTDTLGRTIDDPMFKNWNTTQNQPVGDKVAAFPSLNGGTISATLSWRYLKDPNGGESGLLDTSQTLRHLSTTRCWGNVEVNLPAPHLFLNTSVTTRLCGGGYDTDPPRFNPVVLTKITLANGQSYQFKYNIYGEIEKIYYPSGAYERFQYQANPLIQSNDDVVYDQANRGVSNRWVSAKGDGTDEMQYTYSTNGSVVTTTSPDGIKTIQYLFTEPTDDSSPYGFSSPLVGRLLGEAVLDANNQLIRSKRIGYEFTGPQTGGFYYAKRDFRQTKEIDIFFEPNAASALATMSETTYDTNADPQYFAQLNPKQQKKYNYIVVDVNTAQNGTIEQISALFTQADLATISEVDYLYSDSYKARNMGGLPASSKVKDKNGVIVSQNQILYDDTEILWEGSAPNWQDPGTTARGNATTAKVWKNDTNTWIETHTQFDQYGNVRKTTDARGNIGETEYDATYRAFAIKTKTPIPSDGVSGSNTAFETTMVYDFNTGLPTSTTDANGQTSSMEYNDALLRPTKVTAPNGQQTITEYGAGTTASTRYVKVSSQIDSTNWKQAYSWFDGLGRTVRTQSVDPVGGDEFAMTCYDNMGRVSKTTNPFRGYSTQTCSTTTGLDWTTTAYDTAGRPATITTPDGAVVSTAYSLAATTGYLLGTVTTVTDQAGKLRRSVTNALGQLKRVDEPDGSNALGSITAPNQNTDYTYDTLNNLTTVNQGSQIRTFAYNSLSRLLSATNPESGLIQYGYDNNGNLTTKTDARTITTTYAYDNLNRVKTRSYSDGTTPQVSYFYDNLTNAKGKLIKVTNANSTTEYTAFDILGRVTASKQTTDGVTYGNGSTDSLMTYTYNLGGAMTDQQYPSGRVVKNVLDTTGNLSTVKSSKNAASGLFTYASAFSYTPAGALNSMKLGNGKWESTVFNNRLQPLQIALGTVQNGTDKLRLNFTYGGTTNNGNVQTQTITVPGMTYALIQAYTYDSLNRLATAVETSNSSPTWKQKFSYDRYGNRRFDFTNGDTTVPVSGCTEAICNPTISTSNNQLTSTGYLYDNAGNTTRDAAYQTFTYDAENKQTEVKNSSSVSLGQYWYDGDGKRVKKIGIAPNGQPETTIFVYDAAGKEIAEYSTIVEGTSTAKVNYLTNDHLGSPRINTDAKGDVISRHDYHPFGEEIGGAGGRTTGLNYGSDTVRKQFTGYERDGETDLDFGQARYYAKEEGRFNSPDPTLSSGRPFLPASWNRYSYVLNNPLVLVDPTGLFEWDSTLKDNDKLDSKERARRTKLRNAFTAARTKAQDTAEKALKDGKISQAKYDKIGKALGSYGAENTANGVTVGIGTKDGNPGSTDPIFGLNEKWSDVTADVQVKFDEKFLLGGQADVGIVHEGAHVDDALTFGSNYVGLKALGVSGYLNAPENVSQWQSESNAYHAQSYYFEAMGSEDREWKTWEKKWAKLDNQKQEGARQGVVNALILKNYGLTEQNPGWHMGTNTCRPCTR